MGRVDGSLQSSKAAGATDLGRWPANLAHDSSPEVLELFPETVKRGNVNGSRSTCSAFFGALRNGHECGGEFTYDKGGSAARFFFSAKANSHDRLGSKHPTVKPLDLMQWLVRLVTPRDGTVLDPFSGTGTTGEAAWREGMRAILIEREPEYLADIARRMELAVMPTKRAAVARTKNKLERPEDLPLFAPRVTNEAEPDPLYECEDCGIVRKVSELTSGCPMCGETMVPREPQSETLPFFAIPA